MSRSRSTSPRTNLRRLARALALSVLPGVLVATEAWAGTLVLYTNDFEDIIGERFKTDTGHDIEVVQMSGGNLLARIAAERNNPHWDVVLFDGLGSLYNLDAEGQLRRGWTPENAKHLTEQGRALVPEDAAWMPSGATASCVIAYRTDRVETPPTSFSDLTAPAYRGEIGQADPAVAAPAYPCVAAQHHSMGMEAARALYSGLLDNDLRVFRTNGPVARALAAGEIQAAMLSSPFAYNLKHDGAPIDVVWPQDGAPASSRGVAIQAKSQNLEAAEAFVNWMVEPATQQFLTDNGGKDGLFLSPVEGVEPLPFGPPATARYDIAPADWSAEHEAEIKNWFADQAVN
ncbi:extracellular solute-binding protein [Pseudomonas sp. Marseille-QA0892]